MMSSHKAGLNGLSVATGKNIPAALLERRNKKWNSSFLERSAGFDVPAPARQEFLQECATKPSSEIDAQAEDSEIQASPCALRACPEYIGTRAPTPGFRTAAIFFPKQPLIPFTLRRVNLCSFKNEFHPINRSTGLVQQFTLA